MRSPLSTPALFDECRMVRAHGELVLATVAPLEHAMEGARAGCGRLFLMVDLSEVTFADGSIPGPLRDPSGGGPLDTTARRRGRVTYPVSPPQPAYGSAWRSTRPHIDAYCRRRGPVTYGSSYRAQISRTRGATSA